MGNPPSPPTNISAILNADQNLEITWVDAPNNEDGYEIERSLDGISFSVLETLNTPDVTSYIDESVSDNNDYYYRLRAFNQFGYSDYSDTVSVSVPNIPPSLQQIGDIVAAVGESMVVEVTATDPPSNNIVLTATGFA